ncbi:MAG: transposase [Burkholderiales bacterium]|nr:transposase [Burkholderiales bacterium]
MCAAKRIAFERWWSSPCRGCTLDGGDVSSDGGLLLLRRLEHRLGLLDAAAGVLCRCARPATDRAHAQGHAAPARLRAAFRATRTSTITRKAQERRADADSARERDRPLASAPTLCRLENRASRAAAWAIHEVIIEKFIASFKTPPRELVLGL